jgi:hypothetical protein
VAQDPLDRQLIDAVLSARPPRTGGEIEEAKLASKRPARATAPTAVIDAPAKLDAKELEEPTTEELEALSAA